MSDETVQFVTEWVCVAVVFVVGIVCNYLKSRRK